MQQVAVWDPENECVMNFKIISYWIIFIFLNKRNSENGLKI